MSDELFEKKLREVSLGEPSPTVRERLLARARDRVRARRRARVVQWALTAAAGLIVATNLAFGHVHERKLTALMGQSRAEKTVAWVDPKLYQEQHSMLLLGWEHKESRWLDD